MKYRLTVEQFSPNTNYESELKEWNDRSRYSAPQMFSNGEPMGPQRERVIKVLTVEVTDVEFAAIKKAAVETMA